VSTLRHWRIATYRQDRRRIPVINMLRRPSKVDRAPRVRTVAVDLRINPQAQHVDAPVLVAGSNVDRMTIAAAAVPRHLPLARTGLDRRDDAVSQVLVNIEAFFAHVVSPLLAASGLAGGRNDGERRAPHPKGALAQGLDPCGERKCPSGQPNRKVRAQR
jgi:hypothetical protein